MLVAVTAARVERLGALKCLRGFAEAILRDQRDTEIDPVLRRAFIDRHRATRVPLGFAEPVLRVPAPEELREARRAVGRQRQRVLEACRGIVESLLSLQGHAKPEMPHPVAVIGRDGLAHPKLSGFGARCPHRAPARLQEQGAVLQAPRRRMGQPLARFAMTAELEQRRSAREHQRRLLSGVLQRFVDHTERFGMTTRCHERGGMPHRCLRIDRCDGSGLAAGSNIDVGRARIPEELAQHE